MSTRCRIAIVHDNGVFESIYCHYDGYDDGNGVGPVLRKHHSSPEAIKALIKLGDLSYVKANEVRAYHRDRGDAWANTQPKITASESELLALAHACDADYLYVFDGERWGSKKLQI